MGGLVLAAIDQVPHALIDNAIIMGLLSFLVAFIFLIDLADPLPMRRVSHVQTEANSTHEMGVQANELDRAHNKNGSYARNLAQNAPPQVGHRMDKDYPRQPTLPADRRPPASFAQGRAVNPPQLPLQPRPAKHQPHRVAPEDYPPQPPLPQHHVMVHSDSHPRPQEPVVGHLLTPEKMRAQKSKIPTKGAFIVDEVPKMRRHSDLSEDDTMSRISSHSYVKTTEVDTLPKSSYCRPPKDRESNRECEEVDSPIVPGYVASTAKMWDKRSKSKSGSSLAIGSNTRV